jgi:nitroimidazol reductase NimA-like FMN-containing flavoprotein (pyridoxamine 5'-phosphate oxidase superfamily)
MKNAFTPQIAEKLDNDNKIGLLAIIGDDGYPHMVFINTITALDEKTLAWGQFIQGLSKRLLPEKKNAAFLAVTQEMDVFRGKAIYNHEEKTGEIFERFNMKPLFRYNSYFGIEKAHLMDLKSLLPPDKLKMTDIVIGALASRLAASAVKNDSDAMNSKTRSLFAQLAGLKFIAYEDDDGFPWIVPCIQAAPAGNGSIVFSLRPDGGEIKRIPKDARVAVYFTNMQLQSVMVKGTYRGIERRFGVKSGVVDVEMVYNPMPPASGYIYPREELKKVDQF